MSIFIGCNCCREDIHIPGGAECEYCGREYCLHCIAEHERYCKGVKNEKV